MDHTRLLVTMRQLQLAMTEAANAHRTTRHVWRIHPGVVIIPESFCAFCQKVIRSNAIWLFSNPPRFTLLEGMIPLDGRRRVRMEYPGMPNLTSLGGRGGLCLGTYTTGMDMLAGPANLKDCPMGQGNLPEWYRLYWNHPPCREGSKWLREQGLLSGVYNINRHEEYRRAEPEEEE